MRSIPTEWRDMTANQRDVLLVLAHEQPTWGGQINRDLGRERSGRSAIHRTLRDHEADGYVTVERVDIGERGGERRQYVLTDDGEALLREVGQLWYETNVEVAP